MARSSSGNYFGVRGQALISRTHNYRSPRLGSKVAFSSTMGPAFYLYEYISMSRPNPLQALCVHHLHAATVSVTWILFVPVPLRLALENMQRFAMTTDKRK